MSATELDFRRDTSGLGSPSYQPIRSPGLPEFSFNPGARLSPESASEDRRPRSAALPDFSFNPGATLTTDSSLLSPPLSPSSPRMLPNRGSHRRGGSEFVGGNIRAGESITVMSTSPTNPESGFASPTVAPIDIPPARRGRHAHRRSAAISSHDLTMILKPSSPNPLRGSSAPTSPADFECKVRPFPETSDEQPMPTHSELQLDVESATVNTMTASPVLPVCEPSLPAKPTVRARVGFSDTLEFIPRPLSLVSTDTSSTITGRHGHSVSGSISSIISLSNSTTTDYDMHGILGSPVCSKKGGPRPSTAGAVLERTPSTIGIAAEEQPLSPRRRNSIPLLSNLPAPEPSSSTTPSPSKTPKRWSFFGLESLASSGSPTKARPHSSSSSDSGLKVNSSSENEEFAADEPTHLSDPSNSSGKKKKQKNVKSWAGSILTRKSKSRSQKMKTGLRRSLTPPPSRIGLDDDMENEYVDALEMATEPADNKETSSAQPCIKSEDDTSYPMIDLDAALGPFNTPLSRDPAWDEAQRSGVQIKRQLHSAAGMRGFTGPGMHYHRRAESAPEMPPFEAARFGIHRFGSSSTMADVFEEDEEDEDHTGAKLVTRNSAPDARRRSTADGDSKSVSADDSNSTPTQDLDRKVQGAKESLSLGTCVKRKGSGSSLDMQPPESRMRTETSSTSLHEEVIVEEGPVRRAVDQERIYETIPDSTDLAMPSPRHILVTKDLAPVEVSPFTLPGPSLTPASPYSASHSSSFPSPLSPMSYDAQRISTAPSSVTEENNFQSLLMGEPGPEVVRISVDVPSLTSSNSTMTRESNFPGVHPRNVPFHEQRPASFTSTAFGRRRSSLASLSRLISSAHGERSKLSIEVPCEPDSDKKPKVSAAKRWSRMMQFWKTKESTETES
ncbi:uncharacterized protein BCR38DRAFT_340121 [Pseudomassariella vexata]|uniref:Cell wall proline rich protein n=1 Tax=Pseudomassariella vexata TaxID=1141098 RepID=A0A1Y2E4B0_9PEZI|nr:uncharacterized protein BCR38DRAFT_340121 [Pseudomassariella vexata]ORY66391.1 hypothetical protein BCR38DRAFT_340121 [Pseudomassariella vexata]